MSFHIFPCMSLRLQDENTKELYLYYLNSRKLCPLTIGSGKHFIRFRAKTSVINLSRFKSVCIIFMKLRNINYIVYKPNIRMGHAFLLCHLTVLHLVFCKRKKFLTLFRPGFPGFARPQGRGVGGPTCVTITAYGMATKFTQNDVLIISNTWV